MQKIFVLGLTLLSVGEITVDQSCHVRHNSQSQEALRIHVNWE